MARAKGKTSKKEKKRLIIITFSIVGLLALLVLSVYSDWQLILQNRKEEKELTEKYEFLLDEEKRLSAEAIKLEDDEYLARYAKDRFMLSKDGDLIIK